MLFAVIADDGCYFGEPANKNSVSKFVTSAESYDEIEEWAQEESRFIIMTSEKLQRIIDQDLFDIVEDKQIKDDEIIQKMREDMCEEYISYEIYELREDVLQEEYGIICDATLIKMNISFNENSDNFLNKYTKWEVT